MSKPIESGCMAVIVNSTAGNDGIIVTVGKFVGIEDGCSGRNRWAIDKKVRSVGVKTKTFKGYIKSVDEHQLRRIDDNNEKLSTWEAVESICGFNPAKDVCKED